MEIRLHPHTIDSVFRILSNHWFTRQQRSCRTCVSTSVTSPQPPRPMVVIPQKRTKINYVSELVVPPRVHCYPVVDNDYHGAARIFVPFVVLTENHNLFFSDPIIKQFKFKCRIALFIIFTIKTYNIGVIRNNNNNNTLKAFERKN